MNLPTISFLIPTMGRPEGLKRCLDSIKALSYPKELIEVWVREDDPRIGVPRGVKLGVEQTSGEYIVFASNDVEFTPESLIRAVETGRQFVSFNTGAPEENEHFMIKRSLISKLDNCEIFCTEFWHIGVDNYLTAQLKKLGEYYKCDEAIVTHYHFSRGGTMDEVYSLAWSHMQEDRALLKEKLAHLDQLT